jgi:hypothetical protein
LVAVAALSLSMIGLQPSAATAVSADPLSESGWHLVAHMSASGGMFDGDGNLAAGYEYGAFVADPDGSTADFQRKFPVTANEILFITGDGTVWGVTDYADLRAVIDARAGDFDQNLTFEVGDGGSQSTVVANVLSRPGNVEDPWISITAGTHGAGVASGRIVWGENDYTPGGGAVGHNALKNNHGGIDVYVRAALVTPASKDDCKKGAWRDVTAADHTPFQNQGDCVSYVATGGRNGAKG